MIFKINSGDTILNCVSNFIHNCIPKSEPKILNKLGITAEIWLDTVNEYNKGFHQFIGSEAELKEVCESLNIKWLSGIKNSRKFYSCN